MVDTARFGCMRPRSTPRSYTDDFVPINPCCPGAYQQHSGQSECGGYVAHKNLIDDKQFGAALGHRAVCPCIVGHLVALAGLERYRAAVLEFRDQLTVEDQ